jgi:hypothetical protein
VSDLPICDYDTQRRAREDAADASERVWPADLPVGAWGYPQVQGHCPACGLHSLFLASGGYVTCANIPCSNPTQVTDSLDVANREIERLSISREADMERAWHEGHAAAGETPDYSVNPYSVLPDTAITIAPDALPNGWVHVGQGSRRCTQHGVTECDLHPAGDL